MTNVQERTAAGYHTYRAGPDGTLVLIHGFLDKASTWGPFVEHLELPNWTVLAIELGDFSVPAEVPSNLLDYFARYVADVITRLNIDPEKPLVLVGHSMGGQLVELVAGRLRRVDGLALIVPAPLKGYPLNEQQRQAFASNAAQKDRQSIAKARGVRIAINTPAVLELLVATAAETPVDFSTLSLQAWIEGHASGLVPANTPAPMMLVTSDDKFFTPEFLFEQVLSRFRQGIAAHVADSGHWPHVEQPAALAELIQDFVLQKCVVVADLNRWFFYDYLKKWVEIGSGSAPNTDMLHYWGAPLHAASMIQTNWLMTPEDVLKQIERTQAPLKGRAYSHTVVLDYRITAINKSAGVIDAIWSRRQKDETELQRVASHFEIHMTDQGWRVVAMANRMTRQTALDNVWTSARPALPAL
jgi:pimeloyl-ACP methyl ester carboxylesterase